MTKRLAQVGTLLVVAAAAGWLVVPRGTPSKLLWWEGRAVRWSGDAGVVLSPSGELLAVVGSSMSRLPVRAGGRSIIDAAAGPANRTWLVDADGSLLRREDDGSLVPAGRTPFDIPTLAVLPDGKLWVARSPMQFSFRPESSDAPSVVRLDTTLRAVRSAGSITIPSNPFLAQLANAGQVLAMPDGGVVFAPFIRDLVVRFGRDGGERWRLARGLDHETTDPRLLVTRASGRPDVQVDYAPVNLGLALGPDEHLYVLSTPSATTSASRLDVVDLERGILLDTRRFDTALPTIAVDAAGHITTPDPGRLLPGSDPERREPLEPFDVPAMAGGRLRLEDYVGRVTLLNFWASWCAPCREEMPALDSLMGTLDSARVAFVALSDDVREGAARRFVADHRFARLHVGFGHGKLKGRYTYAGLPFTVLLDARGRIVSRWAGYGGPAQVAAIAELIRLELARAAPPEHHRHAM